MEDFINDLSEQYEFPKSRIYEYYKKLITEYNVDLEDEDKIMSVLEGIVSERSSLSTEMERIKKEPVQSRENTKDFNSLDETFEKYVNEEYGYYNETHDSNSRVGRRP